jgi:hypothetical protein
LYQLPFFKDATGAAKAILGDWQINGIAGFWSGTPYSIGGTNNALNCQGCGSIFINFNGDSPEPIGSAGSSETYYDKSLFSQPTGTGVDGFGTSDRNQFRRPSVWNVDFSVFKAFQIQKVRAELRFDFANLFNHTNWGAPVTSFTANNFLQFIPANSSGQDTSTNSPGPRRAQIGLRLEF